MRRMDTILAAYATLAGIATANPLAAMCALALGPIAIVLLSRNPVGAVIVIGLVIMGLGLALEVTRAGIDVRPFESPVLRMALALWGALWPGPATVPVNTPQTMTPPPEMPRSRPNLVIEPSCSRPKPRRRAW
jgi:hypothetical protein